MKILRNRKRFLQGFNKNCLVWLLLLTVTQGMSAEVSVDSNTSGTTPTDSTSVAPSPSGTGSKVYDQTASYYLNIIANSINNLFADVDAFYKWMAAAATETLPSSAEMITTNTAPESPVDDSKKNTESSTYLGVANQVNYTLTTDTINASLSGSKTSAAKGDESTLNFNSLIGPTAYQDGASTGTTQNVESGGTEFGQSGAAYSFIQYVANTTDSSGSSSSGSSNKDDKKSSSNKNNKNDNIYSPGDTSDTDKLLNGSNSGKKNTKSDSDDSKYENPRNPSRRSYQSAQNNFVAMQSVGMSNLYYLLGERTLQTGLGTKANLQTLPTINADGTISPGTPIADASILQVQEYMAKRRLFNPAWYAQIAGSTSLLGMAKEILYLLAEIRYEQYQDKLLKERELAVLSTLQLQAIQANKMFAEARFNASQHLGNI
jgi:hypothetical protein